MIARRRFRTHTIAVWVLLTGVLCPVAASAQAIRGAVLDDDSGAPIAVAHVDLLRLGGGAIASASTGEDGRFLLRAPRAGAYLLRVTRVGYEEVTSDTVELHPGEIVQITIRLGAQAIPLDPITVVEQSRAFHDLTYDGLYARRALSADVGTWRVWVKGDRDFESAIKASDLLRQVRLRKLVWTNNRPGLCSPIVFWHGFYIRHQLTREAYLERSIDDLEGVEIYTNYHALPLEFRAQLPVMPASVVRNCTVVALWPRRPDYPK